MRRGGCAGRSSPMAAASAPRWRGWPQGRSAIRNGCATLGQPPGPRGAGEVGARQGWLDEARFFAAYGQGGQLVAAVTFDHNLWVEFYQRLIAQAAPFPPTMHGVEQPAPSSPVSAAFPDPRVPTYDATGILTGHDPNEQRVQWITRHHAT